MNKYLQEKQGDFSKAIEFFKKEIANLRTGRANPAILEGVQAEAYGAKTPLNGLANISVSDARSLIVAPWDKSIIKEVEKSIVQANLGVGVVNEGDKIRITIPMMTEENRRELVKKLNEKMEKIRITFRQTREEIKGAIEQAEKDKEIAEDDKFRFMKELDEEAAKKNEELKQVRDRKEIEIMTI
jgi:ribosome recycling factor